MYEIRFSIPNENVFYSFIKKFQGHQIKTFQFEDVYFIPETNFERWSRGFLSMRIRCFKNRFKLLYSQYSLIFKEHLPFIQNSSDQKIILLEDSNEETIEDFLNNINFKKADTIKRQFGKVFSLEIRPNVNLELTFEKIHNFGYTSEIELHENEIDYKEKINDIQEILKNLNATPFEYPLFGAYLDFHGK